MRYDKHSFDYQVNLETLREMEACVPMTKPERDALRRWAKKGYELESNPWDCCDAEGFPLNFLQAYRLQFGYSSGPWDYWKGPQHQTCWDDAAKCFLPKEDFC